MGVTTSIYNPLIDTSSFFWEFTGQRAYNSIRQYMIDSKEYFDVGYTKLFNATLKMDNETNTSIYAKALALEYISKRYESSPNQRNLQYMSDFPQEVDRMIIANLTNNLTNVVCASAAAANGYHAYNNGDTVQTMCGKVSAGDVCSVAAIRRLIFCAKNGIGLDGKESFAIKPTTVEWGGEGSNQGLFKNVYLLFLDSYQVEQLERDREWREIKAIHVNRIEKQNFVRVINVIDNCWIVELPSWGIEQAGLLHSEVDNEYFAKFVNKDAEIVPLSNYHGNNQVTSIGFLLGASACIYAYDEILREESEIKTNILGLPYKQTLYSQCIGVRKSVYDTAKNDEMKKYHNKDFGVIGLITSRE